MNLTIKGTTTMHQPKSLLEISSEICATQFAEVFLDDVSKVKDNKFKLKEGISFPPSLFEEILQTSQDIHCLIPLPYLVPCLMGLKGSHYTNLLLGNYKFENLDDDFMEDLLEGFQPRKVSVRSNCLTYRFVEALSKSSANITTLDLELNCCNFQTRVQRSVTDDGIERPQLECPNLISLTLRSVKCCCSIGMFEYLNISFPPLQLKNLYYHNHLLTSKFLNNLKTLTNLENLSLNNVKDLNMVELKDSILCLTKIRLLDLTSVRFVNLEDEESDLYMTQIINGLPKLAHLDISGTNLVISRHSRVANWLKIKKLSFLGMIGCVQKYSVPTYSVSNGFYDHNEIMAEQIACECCTDHLITALEKLYEKPDILNIVSRKIQIWYMSSSLFQRIFMALLNCLHCYRFDIKIKPKIGGIFWKISQCFKGVKPLTYRVYSELFKSKYDSCTKIVTLNKVNP